LGNSALAVEDRPVTPSELQQLWETRLPSNGGKVFMSLINLIVVLVVVGVLLWLVNKYIPMESRIKSILNLVVLIVVVLWLLNVFGIIPNLSRVRIGR